jgi:cysteine synthase
MQKDVELFEALYPLLRSLNQLQDLIDNTTLAVGSEAFASALQVYNYAKASGQGKSLETLVVDMGQRYVRKHRKPKSQEATF